MFAPLGQKIVKATSGSQALKHLLDQDFAVILMDVQMPVLDGIQTAALIKKRERTRRIPIIFLTAIHRDPSYMFKGYAQGAVDYLLKPFDPEILRSKVSVFVDLYQKAQEIERQAERLREAERRALEGKNEQRYRTLTDALPLCMVAADAAGKVYFCNRRWLEYSGLLVEDTAEHSLELVHPDDREQARFAWAEAVREGKSTELAYRIRRASDGSYRWHLGLMVPERDQRQQIVGWISTATDIDDQRRAREDAEIANRSKDDFLAMVSHELRTPLNAILGWADMLRLGRLAPDRSARAIEIILRNGKSQAQLIEDLLDVSRIVAGKLRMEREPMELGAIVHAAVDTVRPVAEEKKVEYREPALRNDRRREPGSRGGRDLHRPAAGLAERARRGVAGRGLGRDHRRAADRGRARPVAAPRRRARVGGRGRARRARSGHRALAAGRGAWRRSAR